MISIIERLGRAAGLPEECIKQAVEILSLTLGRLRSRSPEAIAVALLYAACRQLKIPKTLAELRRYTGASRREILRLSAAIAALLKLPPPTAADYVRTAAARLRLDANAVNEALEIARKLRNTPPHLAAAVAIYMAARASGKQPSIGEVAEAVGISATSLSRKLKGLVRPERKRGTRKERAVLGPYTLARSAGRNEYVIEGVQALELAYNLYEAGAITSADLARIEKRMTAGRSWRLHVNRRILLELGAEFIELKDIQPTAIRGPALCKPRRVI